MQTPMPDYHDSLDGIAPPAASRRLIGHQRAVADLLAIVRGGHHAVLLEGEQGIGKATAAFHLAHALLSGWKLTETALPHPDPASAEYRQIVGRAHPNLKHLTRPPAASGKGFKTVITIDEVRTIQHFLAMTASADRPRIIIIDPVGDMPRGAANALLKTLEEPPANTLFLLVSHGAGGLLATIRSRCQRIRFEPLQEQDVAETVRLVGGQSVAADQVQLLAAMAGGSPRRALVMALYGGGELRQSLDRLLEGPRFDTPLAHKLADVAGGRGNDTHNVLLREMMDEALGAGARSAARAGNSVRANALASLQAEMAQSFAQADGFGLDRKQEFLVAAARLHAMLHKH